MILSEKSCNFSGSCSRLESDQRFRRALRGFDRLRFGAAEHLVDCAPHDARLLAGEAVEDGLAGASGLDQAVRTQTCELLRHRRLAQRQQLLELRDRLLAL